MATSIREQILANVETTLQGITVANGYDIDMAEVHRVQVPGVTVNDFPASIIIDGNETKQLDGLAMNETRYDVFMPLVIEAWSKERGSPHISTVISQLLANIEKAMMVNPNRGTHDVSGKKLALDTQIRGNEPILAQDEEPYGGVRVLFEVRYRHLIGDPFSC